MAEDGKNAALMGGFVVLHADRANRETSASRRRVKRRARKRNFGASAPAESVLVVSSGGSLRRRGSFHLDKSVISRMAVFERQDTTESGTGVAKSGHVVRA